VSGEFDIQLLHPAVEIGAMNPRQLSRSGDIARFSPNGMSAAA
jgi:hypothetical protein